MKPIIVFLTCTFITYLVISLIAINKFHDLNHFQDSQFPAALLFGLACAVLSLARPERS